METRVQELLATTAAAWGVAMPRPSAKYEWEPGCVHHGRSVLWRREKHSLLLPHQSSWLRLKPFIIGDIDDVKEDTRRKRAFVDVVALLGGSPSFNWRENREFWQETINLYIKNPLVENARKLVQRSYCGGTSYEDPCFMIDFQYTKCDAEKLEWCFAFLTASTAEVLSPEMLTLCTSSRYESRWISIGFDLNSCNLQTGQLVQLYKVLKAYAEFQSEPNDGQSVQLVVTSLNLNSNLLCARDYEILADILLLQSPRVAIRHLNLARTCNIFGDPTSSFQFFIQQILRDDLSSIEELVIGEDGVAFDVEFAVIFSALRYSTKLRTLRIQQHPGREFDDHYNAAAVWSWFALAVLHPSSASQLQELALPHVKVTESVVETTRNTLSSAHPGFITLTAQTNLLNEDDLKSSPAGEIFVVVKRRTRLRNWPKLSSWAIPLDKSAIDRPLEVVATLVDWICVIVPGYGFAWVRENAVVARERRDVVQTRTHTLRSFMWEPPNSYDFLTDAPAISALVRLLGQELRALHLPRTLISADVLRLMLLEHASLEHMEVQLHGVRSLDFLKEYERSSLHSLAIQFDASTEEQASVISPTTVVSALTAFLASPPGHAISGIAFECARADSEQVEQLLGVIAQHPKLENVSVCELLFGVSDPLKYRIMTLDGQMVSHQGPSQLVKLAFLSVIGPGNSTQGSALHRLDAALVSSIFGFAATPVYRHVEHFQRVINPHHFESTVYFTR